MPASKHEGAFRSASIGGREVTHRVEGVEKAGSSLRFCHLGGFDPAETSRLLILKPLEAGGSDANPTEVIVRALRQPIHDARLVEDRGFEVLGS